MNRYLQFYLKMSLFEKNLKFHWFPVKQGQNFSPKQKAWVELLFYLISSWLIEINNLIEIVCIPTMWSFMVIYGTIWKQILNTLYISREPLLATFTQLKLIPFFWRKYFGSLKTNVLKVYIYIYFKILLAKE